MIHTEVMKHQIDKAPIADLGSSSDGKEQVACVGPVNDYLSNLTFSVSNSQNTLKSWLFQVEYA